MPLSSVSAAAEVVTGVDVIRSGRVLENDAKDWLLERGLFLNNDDDELTALLRVLLLAVVVLAEG